MYVGVNRYSVNHDDARYTVFPMYVGVNRITAVVPFSSLRIPHVCGGEPLRHPESRHRSMYSPCMWG